MSPAFSGDGFALAVLRADTRDELVRILAKFKVVPTNSADDDSHESEYVFERRVGGESANEEPADEEVRGEELEVSPETQRNMLQMLGIESDEDCEATREEIEDHPMWGFKV